MLNDCLILTIIANGSYSEDWPKIEVFENNISCGVAKIQESTEVDFPIQLNNNQNIIRIAYTNKTETSTKVKNGVIVSDQFLEIKDIRLSNILLDKWILTESDYYPRYFSGFLADNPTAKEKLRSQLIWHFPGNFIMQPLPSKENFWDWYYHQQRCVYVKEYYGKDKIRNDEYTGSVDPLLSLMNEVRALINV